MVTFTLVTVSNGLLSALLVSSIFLTIAVHKLANILHRIYLSAVLVGRVE